MSQEKTVQETTQVVPFFARFLEVETAQEETSEEEGYTITKKFPSDWEEY